MVGLDLYGAVVALSIQGSASVLQEKWGAAATKLARRAGPRTDLENMTEKWTEVQSLPRVVQPTYKVK